MKKVQLNRYHAALRVQNYLKENADLYAHNVQMVSTAAFLNAKMTELDRQGELQIDDSKGWTMHKRSIRKDLENQAFVLSSGCCVYALTTENTEFYRHCYFTKSDLLHMRDTDFWYNCGNLLKSVTEHAAELLPFNITPEMIVEFDIALTNFKEIAEKPRDAISARAHATAQIQVIITEIMSLIHLRLDKVMVSMIATQPDFVATYKLLRRIKKAPVHKRSLTVIVKDADTGKPLAEAAIETGNKIQRHTGVKGQSYVAHLPEGRYKLGVSLPGYDSQSLKYTVVHSHATKVEVLMKRTVVESVKGLIIDLGMADNVTYDFLPSKN